MVPYILLDQILPHVPPGLPIAWTWFTSKASLPSSHITLQNVLSHPYLTLLNCRLSVALPYCFNLNIS